MTKARLSVVTPTYNEEENIAQCIESVRWANEIIVVDADSGDATPEICKRAGVSFIRFTGKRPRPEPQRWLGIQRAKHDWILCLDADERPSEGLTTEIIRLLNSGTSHNGFEIPFKHFMFGRRMKHGGLAGNYLLRLVKRESAYYPRGGFVHEQLCVKGTTGRLNNPIFHYGTRDLTHYFEKFNFYTSLTAEKLHFEGVRVGYYNALSFFGLKPLYYFCKRFFLQKGFLDGKYGFFLASLTALTVMVNYLKLLELQKKEKNEIISEV
jgi:glycosyltransferase involved in cell wall biosynthesis